MKKQLLFLVMILLPMIAHADKSGICGDNLTWTLDESTGTLTIEGSGAMKDYSSSSSVPWFEDRENISTVVIGDGVTNIGQDAFYQCYGLTTVTIPNSVTNIGNNAFWDCSRLTSVTIPNSVISIGRWAFCGCSGLKSITIPNCVKEISESSFERCSGLTSVTIPNNVIIIGNSAFEKCTGLKSITIPNSVMSIGGLAFYNCSGLTSVTIGKSVISIGRWAFYGCSGLKSITIPNSVTIIDYSAFAYCSGLTSITIGNSVASIGDQAFYGANISTVISLIENPFTIYGKSSNDKVFSLNTFNNATLYVPLGTIEKYKATEGWKDFAHIEEGNPAGINVVENTKINKTAIYDLNGVRQPEPKKGINIVNGKKVIVK